MCHIQRVNQNAYLGIPDTNFCAVKGQQCNETTKKLRLTELAKYCDSGKQRSINL